MAVVHDILTALDSWTVDPSPLIGVFESKELEFKKTAYNLQTDADKSEFAKDIAGMANAGGGLIVLGIETERDAAAGRDRSKRVRPLAPGTVLVPQMESVARTWVYPPQRGLEIREWPDDAGQMLVSMLVPGHDDLGGLVVVLGPGDPPDRRTIGVPIRSSSRVDFHTAPEIYEWIRRGRLQAEIARPDEGRTSAEDADAQLARVRSEFVEAEPEGTAIFSLQAWPATGTRVDKLHDRDGVRGLFLDPPQQRWGGFGWWGLQPEGDASGGVRVSSGRVSLWITPNAVATLVVSEEYLTWAMERFSSIAKGPLINSTALGEFVYEFCRTYLLILGWSDPRPSQEWLRFGLFRAREPFALYLGRGGPEQIEYAMNASAAPADDLLDTIGPFDATDSDELSERIAARTLRAIYSKFGLGREAIPHLVDDGERFDPASLSRVR